MKQSIDIYLIRHTQPAIEAGVCYGQLDCDVAADYATQLSKMGRYFSNKKIARIYSSPLRRCASLAQDLATQYIDAPVNFHEGLKEINFGEWEGVKWDAIAGDKIDEWNNNRLNFQFPCGETPLTFHQRIVKTWSEHIALPVTDSGADPETILVVAHAGVIRSILCHCLQIPLQYSTQLTIDYASISLLNLSTNGLHCAFMNRCLD